MPTETNRTAGEKIDRRFMAGEVILTLVDSFDELMKVRRSYDTCGSVCCLKKKPVRSPTIREGTFITRTLRLFTTEIQRKGEPVRLIVS